MEEEKSKVIITGKFPSSKIFLRGESGSAKETKKSKIKKFLSTKLKNGRCI